MCPLLVLCPAFAAAKLAAQQPVAGDSTTISGTVRAKGGAPAGGVTVELVGTAYRTTTTDSGAFSLLRVAPGTYTLVAHGPQWATARVGVTVAVGERARVDVIVSPVGEVAAVGGGTTTLAPVNVEGVRNTNSAQGPSVSPTGSNQYTMTASDIANLPTGDNTTITDVLTQMPGVAIDQNQQIHFRNTEGPQFQYQIDGALVPLDINTNPPFISMINPMFASRIDLLDGILPSRYSYATGGVVDIQTKGGCDQAGGDVSILVGQRNVIEPSLQYAGCAGKVSYYVSGIYQQGQTAFSSATPGPNPIHNYTNQGQGFGHFSVPLSSTVKLSVTLSAAASNNQLPNVPDLSPAYSLAGSDTANSSAINSYLNFRDYLGMVTLSAQPSNDLSYQITYAAHSISQIFVPDNSGELIYQGVASTASHDDRDNTLQGDVTYRTGRHTISSGFYLGAYDVVADDRSLVFPVDSLGNQSSSTPITVVNNAEAVNILSGVYINDLWQINDRLRLNVGLRWDDLTGFTAHNQFDPTINLSYLLSSKATMHLGFARYMQVPSFQGISPSAPAAFMGTTAEGPPGTVTPTTEDDIEWDGGVVFQLTPRLSLSQDLFYEINYHYLDTGQFGVVPIFAPFNYDRGYIWGSESAVAYSGDHWSTYANLTIGNNLQKGVATGQFNFDPDELAYINTHDIVLDHQPLFGASAGATYKWKEFSFLLAGVYSSGLRAGFADLEKLPTVVQINFGIQGDFKVGTRTITDRLTFLNLLDRVNLIRPAEGIGIFQSAYTPRFTIQNTLTVPF